MQYPPLTLGWFIYNSPIDGLEFIGDTSALDQPISGISVLDNPDGVLWIKKNEIILTTGYIFLNDIETQKQVIADLHAINCTAFCIKVNRYFKEIPEIIIEEAAKYKVPLVAVPYYHVYSNIIQVINDNLMNHTVKMQQRVFAELENFHQIFLKKEGIQLMLQHLSDYTHTLTMITTTAYMPLYYNIPLGSEYAKGINYIHVKDLEQHIPSENAVRKQFFINDALRDFELFPIPDDKHYLCIDVTDVFLDEFLNKMIQQIGIVFSLELSRIQVNSQIFVQKNYFDSFFNMLSEKHNKSLEDIEAICDVYGFPYHLKRICVTLEYQTQDHSKRQSIYHLIEEKLKMLKVSHFISHNSAQIVFFLFFPKDMSNTETFAAAKHVIELTFETLKSFHSDFLMGVSRSSSGLDTISKSYEESLKTIRIKSPKVLSYQVNYYFDQYAFHLLSKLNPNEVSKLYEDTIAVIIHYDTEYHSELFVTLKAFLSHNLSIKETASSLFIHRNTLTTRINLVRKLLCMEINSIEEILNLQLGICAYEIIH